MRHSVGLWYISDNFHRNFVFDSLIVVGSKFPNSWYSASDRQFIGATVITCIITLIALLLFFAAT